VAKRCCSGSGRWEGPAVLRVNLQGRGGVRIVPQRRKGSKSYLGASSLKRWSWRRRGSGARRLRRWKRRLGGSGSSSAARALRGTYTQGRRIKGWLYPWRPTAGKNRAHMRRLTGGEKAVVVRTQGRGRLHFVHAPLRGGQNGHGRHTWALRQDCCYALAHAACCGSRQGGSERVRQRAVLSAHRCLGVLS
jgi:hypothetical protein